MKISSLPVIVALALLLGGCAFNFGMDRAECARENWELRGEREGGYGMMPQIDQYAAQCARHGVQASRELYLKGWRIGISEFSGKGGGPD